MAARDDWNDPRQPNVTVPPPSASALSGASCSAISGPAWGRSSKISSARTALQSHWVSSFPMKARWRWRRSAESRRGRWWRRVSASPGIGMWSGGVGDCGRCSWGYRFSPLRSRCRWATSVRWKGQAPRSNRPFALGSDGRGAGAGPSRRRAAARRAGTTHGASRRRPPGRHPGRI